MIFNNFNYEKNKLILSFSFLLLLSNSNIWDNIYSQANSHHFEIPEEFTIKLINDKDNSTAGQLKVSCELSLIKFIFILDEADTEDSFIHFLLDFNTGKIYFDTQEKCVYLYYDLVEQVSPKFILNAYDLLSYYSEGDDNNYHYIVTNPLELDEDEMTGLPLLLKNILIDIDNIVLKNKTIYDKSFYVDFIINKDEMNITALSIKARDAFVNYNTYFNQTKFTPDDFNGIHSISECYEYKGK